MLNKLEQTRLRLQKAGKKIFNLSSGNPGEFGVQFPQAILTHAFEQFQKNSTYIPEPKGDPAARQAVSQFYAARTVTVSPENILLTSGTSESYLHLFKLLAGPAQSESEILFPNPAYPLFDHLAKLANIRLNHYELDADNDWQINMTDLAAKISSKTKAIVLISPNNPTGGVLTQDTMQKVLALAEKHHLPIISDEVFSEFIFEGKTFPRITSSNVDIFTLNGISKTYALPGLKLSWLVVAGPNAQNHIDTLELSIDTILAANQISQKMLPAIITHGDEFIKTFDARLEQSRNIAITTLSKNPNISFVKPAGGFYLFAQIKNFHALDGRPGTDEQFALKILEETGIFIHPGYFYDYEKDLRVLISFLAEPAELAQKLELFVKTTDQLCDGQKP